MSSEAAEKAYPEKVLPLYPEPPIGTWARDRFGAITYRQENGGWGQPGVMPYGKWEAMYEARGPYVETGAWGKPLGGGAMSTRDELRSDLSVVKGLRGAKLDDLTDWMHAKGWRKMPTVEAVMAILDDDMNWDQGELSPVLLMEQTARAILALMDGGQ